MLLAGVVASVLIPLIALDESRVTAIVCWPALLWLVTSIVESRPAKFAAIAARLMPIALVVPVLVVWQGTLLYPGLGSAVHVLFP